jgi:nucleoside diphosphate kinase
MGATNPKDAKEGTIRKKYGMMAKMIMKGPDENRAIIRLEEKGGEK